MPGGAARIPRSSSTAANPFCAIQSDRPSSRTAACSGPCRSSADVVMTTSAPASRCLATSAGSSTPVVAASAERTRPRSSAIHVRGSRPSVGLERPTPDTTASLSGSMSGCRNRLKSTSPSAPASSSRSAISPIELKCGLSLTATGTVTASLTRVRTSMWRCSTSRPGMCQVAREIVDVQLDRGRTGILHQPGVGPAQPAPGAHAVEAADHRGRRRRPSARSSRLT